MRRRLRCRIFTDVPAELERRKRPCVGGASHCDWRCGEGWTDVWDVSDARLEWPGRFGDEWAMGADYWKRAIYAATLASWFGVSPSQMATIFPNIGSFPTMNLGLCRGNEFQGSALIARCFSGLLLGCMSLRNLEARGRHPGETSPNRAYTRRLKS